MFVNVVFHVISDLSKNNYTKMHWGPSVCLELLIFFFFRQLSFVSNYLFEDPYQLGLLSLMTKLCSVIILMQVGATKGLGNRDPYSPMSGYGFKVSLGFHSISLVNVEFTKKVF
jgi:hypothetical protein